MKLFLFGGAEVSLGQVEPELQLIEEVIKESGVKQVLHIPFARTIAKEVEWEGDWFHRYIHLTGIEYLNATIPEDIVKAHSPLVFISGGSQQINLLEKINKHEQLLNIIKNADYIIGESAGAKILGDYLRVGSDVKQSSIVRGLGIIKDTIIEAHYSEQHRQELLKQEMELNNIKYGIGIDCVTAIVFELGEFPGKHEKIGVGSVVMKVQ